MNQPYWFNWKLSYQNEREYEVYGVATIETYSKPPAHLEEYQRKTFNGDAASYDYNNIGKWGGARISWKNKRGEATYRWEPRIWEEFTAWRKAEYDKGQAYVAKCKAENPEIDYSDCTHDFDPLKPIYWSDTGWAIDPLATAAEVAA